MKIYIAGTTVCSPEKEHTLQALFKSGHKLHSYYHLFALEKNWWLMNLQNKVELFLDSGAFSAWSKGVEIDINEYIEFIKEHQKSIDVYANLDVIGDPEATWRNQLIMEKAGLFPIPTFHYGESLRYLKRYIRKYEYVAIGGMVGIKGTQLQQWLDRIFLEYICDSEGMPKVKIHGFGMTSLRLMLRYPWFSVDSTSWVVTGRMGSVYVPIKRNGKYIYNEDSLKISVSNKSPDLKKAGQHIETLPPIVRRNVLEYIESKGYCLGHSEFKHEKQDYVLKENERWAEKIPTKKTLKRSVEIVIEPGLSNTYQLRDELNIIYFLDLESNMKKWPWAFNSKKEVFSGFF